MASRSLGHAMRHHHCWHPITTMAPIVTFQVNILIWRVSWSIRWTIFTRQARSIKLRFWRSMVIWLINPSKVWRWRPLLLCRVQIREMTATRQARSSIRLTLHGLLPQMMRLSPTRIPSTIRQRLQRSMISTWWQVIPISRRSISRSVCQALALSVTGRAYTILPGLTSRILPHPLIPNGCWLLG